MNTNQKATNAYCGMMNKTFENIVGRVFLNSIPISKEELTPEVRRGLTNYAVSVMESAGGIDLLTNTILSETNPQRKSYLMQMFDICNTTSKEVADRIAFEAAHGGKNVPKKTVKASATLVVNIIKECVKELSKTDEMKTLFMNNRGVSKCTKVTAKDPAVVVTVLNGDAAEFVKFRGFLKKLNKMIAAKMPESAGNFNIKLDYNTASFTVTAKPAKNGATESVIDIFDFGDFEMDSALEAGEEENSEEKDEKSDDDDTEKDNEADEEKKDDEDETDDEEEETTEEDDKADGEEEKESEDADEKEDEEEDKPDAEAPAITVRSLQTANLDVKMTDDEYEKFNKNVDSLDLAKVSNIVNEKIVNAIDKEKENYHEMDASNARLKEAIMKDDSVADDSAAESVMENILIIPKQKYQSEYQSLFSKLQLMAVESIMLKPGIDVSKLDTDIITDITINSTFDVFNKVATESSLINTLDKAMSMQAALEGTNACCDDKTYIALGTAFATIIMTLLETLHTFGFINPSTGDIKNVVNNDTTVAKSVATINDDVANKVDIALENNEKKINGYKSSGAVETALVNLGTLKNKLLDASESGLNISFDTFVRLDTLIEKARTKLAALEAADHVEVNYDLSNESRHNNDVIKANRIQKYVAARKPETTEFICTESVGCITVDVNSYRGSKVVYHSSMALEGTHNGITAEDYVNLIVNKSNFAGMPGMKIRGNNKTIKL